MPLRVVGAQIPVTNDIAANERVILRALEHARGEKADILLTPEGSLSGYRHDFDPAAATAALARVTAAAREAAVGLALGTCFIEPADGKCYNQLRFYDKSGAFIGFHSKILRTGTIDPDGGMHGEVTMYADRELRSFQFNGAHVGGLVCNDMWANPSCTPMPDMQLALQLGRRGARVIFHAVNGARKNDEETQRISWNFHESNLLMRAKAAKAWIVTVDNSYPLDRLCAAPSGIISPEGKWVARAEPMGLCYFAHTISDAAISATK